jgi:flagellin
MTAALSAAVRANLLALQQIANNMTQSQQRLATGRRVNSAYDDPSAFATSSALAARAGALNAVIGDIGNAQMVVRTAGAGMDSIQQLIGTARDLASRALNATGAERQALAQDFDAIRTQIDQLAKDAGFNGQNLLAGDNVTVKFNEDGSSSVTVSGAVVNAANLGINSAVVTGGNFQNDADINTFLADLDAASSALESRATSYGSSSALLASREDFARSMVASLQSGADDLVLGDINEEAVQLLALQTHQRLAVTALSLANRAQSSVLRLFDS